MVKKYIKNTIKFLFRMYYRIRSFPFMWLYVLNNKGRKLYVKFGKELSSVERRAVRDLETYGVAIAHISEFFPSDVFEELQGYAQKRWQDPVVQEKESLRNEHIKNGKLKSKDYFLVELWKGAHEIDVTNPFLRFSLSLPVLSVVNGYMRMWSKFRYWSLQVTLPVLKSDEKAWASQQWHRDPDDRKLVKVFLYLNDVDENAGPFTYVSYSNEKGKWRNLFPQHPPQGTEKMTDDADSHIPKSDVRVCTGKAGTLIFCDTSGLHRGGFAKSKNRFMYTSAYTSGASVWPIRYVYPAHFDTKKIIDPVTRFAVENDPQQKEPAWY